MTTRTSQRSFRKVLENRLGTETGEADSVFGGTGISLPLVGEKQHVGKISGAVEKAYAGNKQAQKRPLQKTRSVTEELGDLSKLNKAQLERLRRKFAQQNHPDRVKGTDQKKALARMSLANQLIDKAIEKRRAC